MTLFQDGRVSLDVACRQPLLSGGTLLQCRHNYVPLACVYRVPPQKTQPRMHAPLARTVRHDDSNPAASYVHMYVKRNSHHTPIFLLNCNHDRTFVQVEWRKRYRKYRPLRQPASCNDCHKKTITSAYHKICTPCARERRVCPWCCTKGRPRETSEDGGEGDGEEEEGNEEEGGNGGEIGDDGKGHAGAGDDGKGKASADDLMQQEEEEEEEYTEEDQAGAGAAAVMGGGKSVGFASSSRNSDSAGAAAGAGASGAIMMDDVDDA